MMRDKDIGMVHGSRGCVSQSVSEAQWGRCALQVVVIITRRVWPKRI